MDPYVTRDAATRQHKSVIYPSCEDQHYMVFIILYEQYILHPRKIHHLFISRSRLLKEEREI